MSSFHLVEHDWKCPYCNRYKLDCTRWGHGIKHEYLVYHHDHIVDYVNFRAEEFIKDFNVPHLTDRQAKFISRIKAFSQQFSPTLICEDCNNIEGPIKIELKLEKYFTFYIPDIIPHLHIKNGYKHRFNRQQLDYISKNIVPHALMEYNHKKRVIGGLLRAMFQEDVSWGPGIDHGYKELKRNRTERNPDRPSRRGVGKRILELYDQGKSVKEIAEEIQYVRGIDSIINLLFRKKRISSRDEIK